MACSGEFQVSLGDMKWKLLVQFVKVGITLGENDLVIRSPTGFCSVPRRLSVIRSFWQKNGSGSRGVLE